MKIMKIGFKVIDGIGNLAQRLLKKKIQDDTWEYFI
jgi:hypothetical protein